MLWGAETGALELRREGDGSVRLRGSFPYGKVAVLSDGGRSGRPRKEIIEPRAFAYRVERSAEDIHMLVGHSYDRPLASRGAGTLLLRDTDDLLLIEATIGAEMQRAQYVQDFLSGLAAGLVTGLSPGFRIPPERAVADAEEIEQEEIDEGRGMFGALIRRVKSALLYEISAVTRPAYTEAQIEARNWTPAAALVRRPVHPAARWR